MKNRVVIASTSLLATMLVTGCAKYGKLVDPSFMEKAERKTEINSLHKNLVDQGVQGLAVLNDPECQVTIKLATFDGVVASHPVCIKKPDQPISIPDKIALFVPTGKNKNVKYKRYCDPSFGKDIEGLGYYGCVWNRKLFNNYPIGFEIEAPNKDLVDHVSLVRILRNGRSVYTWKRGDETNTRALLKILPQQITSPEAFREPVDLGVYILETGADPAKAAAESNYAVNKGKWSSRLREALEAATSAAVPESIQQEFACYKHRIEYIEAISRNSYGDTKKAKKAMEKLDTLAAELDTYQAYAVAHPLRLATEQPFDPKKVERVDGVVIAPKERVLVLNKDGAAATIYRLRDDSKSWDVEKLDASTKNLDFASDPFTADEPPANHRIVAIKEGRFAGRVYRMVAPTADGGSSKIHRHFGFAGCKNTAEKVKDAHDQLLTEIGNAAKSLKAGAGKNVYDDLEKKVHEAMETAKADLSKAIESLPAEAQEEMKRSFFWSRVVQDTFATVLDGTNDLAASAAQLKTDIQSNLRDPAVQLRTYQSFVAALPSEDSFFSKPQPNPAPGPGEARLPMTFHQPSQTYFLLPWNGVPIALNSTTKIETEPRVDNLLPFLDIVGWSWQIENRYLNVAGLGLGVLGTRETIAFSEDDRQTSDFNGGPQINLSISGLRLGLGYMLRPSDGCPEGDVNCRRGTGAMRLMLGADIIRFFTGKDTAAISPDRGTGAETN